MSAAATLVNRRRRLSPRIGGCHLTSIARRLVLVQESPASETLTFPFRGRESSVTYAQLRAAGDPTSSASSRLTYLLPTALERAQLGVKTRADVAEFVAALGTGISHDPTATALFSRIATRTLISTYIH